MAVTHAVYASQADINEPSCSIDLTELFLRVFADIHIRMTARPIQSTPTVISDWLADAILLTVGR